MHRWITPHQDIITSEIFMFLLLKYGVCQFRRFWQTLMEWTNQLF